MEDNNANIKLTVNLNIFVSLIFILRKIKTIYFVKLFYDFNLGITHNHALHLFLVF